MPAKNPNAAPAPTRIYLTTDPSGKQETLVRAARPGRALQAAYRVRIATQKDLERLLPTGLKVIEFNPAEHGPAHE